MNAIKESDYMSKPTESLTREFLIAQVLEERILELDRAFHEKLDAGNTIESGLILPKLTLLREIKIEALKRLSKQSMPF